MDLSWGSRARTPSPFPATVTSDSGREPVQGPVAASAASVGTGTGGRLEGVEQAPEDGAHLVERRRRRPGALSLPLTPAAVT
jgi:hypothetical protein